MRSDDDFRAALRNQIDGREILEHADGIVRETTIPTDSELGIASGVSRITSVFECSSTNIVFVKWSSGKRAVAGVRRLGVMVSDPVMSETTEAVPAAEPEAREPAAAAGGPLAHQRNVPSRHSSASFDPVLAPGCWPTS